METLGTYCKEEIVVGFEALKNTLAERKKYEGFWSITGKRGFGVHLQVQEMMGWVGIVMIKPGFGNRPHLMCCQKWIEMTCND